MVKNKGKSIKRKRIINVLKTTQGKVVLLIGFLIAAVFMSSVSFATYNSKFNLSYGPSLDYHYSQVTSVAVGGTVDATLLKTNSWRLFADLTYVSNTAAVGTTCKIVHPQSNTVIATGIRSTYSDPNGEDYKSYYFSFSVDGAYKGTNDYVLLFEGSFQLTSSMFKIIGLATASDVPEPVADVIAPSISITTPTANLIIPVDTSYVIAFSATDANGIASYRILIDGIQVATANSFNWDVSGENNGTHVIKCEATDPSGNTNSRSVTVYVGEDDGSVPPEPSTLEFIETSADLTYANVTPGDAEITWLVAAESLASFRIYQNGTLIAGQGLAGTEVPIVLSIGNLGPGVYEFNCTVFDSEGNKISDVVIVKVTGESGLFGMDQTTLIIIVVVALVLFGGGGAASRRD